MDIKIYSILEAGIHAPSGENAQPWRFRLNTKTNTIELHNNPGSDQSLYNYSQYASYLANGTAIENISITSRANGFEPMVTLFPMPEDKNYVARIELRNSKPDIDPLNEHISRRVTNRKPYQSDELPAAVSAALVAAVNESGFGTLQITNDREAIKRLALAGATNERVMLENKAIHNFFFSHVNWTKKEDEQKKVGFYIETLELPPPARAAFKLIRKWPLARILNKIGFSRQVQKQNAMGYEACSAVGVFSMKGSTPHDFVSIGRAIERMWLTATKLGYYIQPMTGVLFFMLRISSGDTQNFSDSERALIENAYRDICQAFDISADKTIPFMFRIGKGEPPSARSTRFSVEVVTEIISE